MKKQLKAMAAAATLAIGLGAGAHAAQREDISPQQDVFYPNIYIDFQTAACTKDDHTVKAVMRITPSITDLREMKANGETIKAEDIQKHIDSAWKEFTEIFKSTDMMPGAPDDVLSKMREHFQNTAEEMVDNIEKDTGLTIRAKVMIHPPTPGCSP